MTSLPVDSIHRSLAEICVPDETYSWDNPRRFSSYVNRLQLVLNQFLRLYSPENFPAAVLTALKGIAGDLTKSVETTSIYRSRSKIFVLINCKSLSGSLQEQAVAIGGWLALLDSALNDHPDTRKKVADLSREMKQAQFRVTDNEERVCCTLQKEGQGRQTRKVVQRAIIMDVARALGIESDNHTELSEQVKLLKNDLAGSNLAAERRMLLSLEMILDNWSTEPDISTCNLDLDLEEDAHISPFKNFLCPLTKEVMKDPVVLESSQTYERTAIQYWFERCIEDGRDPTCPVTGQVLKSLEKKPNIGLAGAIEEWVNRVIEIKIKLAVKYLSDDPPPAPDSMEQMLDSIYKISEEHPSSRYRVRNSGVVVLLVKMLSTGSKSFGSHLRTKTLMVLVSMTKDEESKKIMLEEGITRFTIHSLIGSSDKEREYAVKLLREFSSDEAYCLKIASEKGALVLLSSMAGNLEHPAEANLAEEVLKRMEALEGNVQHLAAAGRFEPLLTRLSDGGDDVKVEMASLVGRMTLTNNSKEQIARRSAKTLVELLHKSQGRTPILKALDNLSTLDDNATILIDSSVLPALVEILFDNPDSSPESKELAAATIANIVSKHGHWELAPTDNDGNSMQSGSIVFKLLGLLSIASPRCQASVLRILYGIGSSPQASESVATHIISGDGIETILPFLEHPETEHKVYAFRLTRVLSERFSQDLANELKPSNKLSFLKDKVLDYQSTDGERADAACILANLPLSLDEVNSILGSSFLKWIVTTLKDPHRPSSNMVEGLFGILIHFTRNLDRQSLSIKEYHLMTLFREQLGFHSKPKVKQLSALGLKYLSEPVRGRIISGDPEPRTPQGFFSFFMFMCGKGTPKRSLCPIHDAPCREDEQFCLVSGNCIKPLVELLSDEDTSVQIAAVEALSTLLFNTSSNNLKRVVDELDRLDVVKGVVALFTEVRPGELQEKTSWMVERILRVESYSTRYALDQSLVRVLVEALRHGNTNTKTHAQEALTNLKQLSGVCGQSSTNSRGRRS